MAQAPITLDTELVLTGEHTLDNGMDLPEGATGRVLRHDEGSVLVEWSYYNGRSPWAAEHNYDERIDLDDWAVWTNFGFEEPDED